MHASDHVRAEAGALVRRSAAQSTALFGRREGARRKFRAPSEHLDTSDRKRRKRIFLSNGGARGDAPAAIASQSDLAGSPCQLTSALALGSGDFGEDRLEIRDLQRTEVRDVEEPFSEGQKAPRRCRI